MEKARLDRIRQLLKIIERERHHELLLFAKNLQDLGTGPFPYIMRVLPRPFLSEVIKGEHFILADLLKSLPRGFTQAEAVPSILSTFGCEGPQVCPPRGDKVEEEVRAGKGYRRGTGGVCGLDEFDS